MCDKCDEMCANISQTIFIKNIVVTFAFLVLQ